MLKLISNLHLGLQDRIMVSHVLTAYLKCKISTVDDKQQVKKKQYVNQFKSLSRKADKVI